MSIAAERFKFLDKETTVAIANFQEAASSAIYNSPNLNFPDIDSDLASFFENDLQVSKIDLSKAKDAATRVARDALGAIKDIKGLSEKDINKAIAAMIPSNSTAQSIFAKLGPKCQTKGLATGNLGKPYDLDINCGGKNRKGKKDGCNSAAYANVLNKATNGAYNATHSDLNSALRNIVALSKFGYDMNMCGVFTALTGDLSNDVLSRASGALLGHLGNTGNVLGFLDLSGASAGLHALTENPLGLRSVLNNFKRPEEIKEADLRSLYRRMEGGLELFDEGWDQSDFDGMLNADLTDGSNEDLQAMLEAAAADVTVTEDDLDAVPDSNLSFMASAYSCGEADMDFSFA